MKNLKKFDSDEIEILSGLRNKIQKKINPKFFYNERGSILFDKITKQKEYYPTKTEIEILKAKRKDISNILPKFATIIEFGSGSDKKILSLIKALKEPKKYFPVDISKEYLLTTSKKFSKKFPKIQVDPICIDFMKIQPSEKKKIIKKLQDSKKVVGFFPGSTIGNFEPKNAKVLLSNFSELLDKNNYLVIGVDLLKEEKILENAYNDKSGYTAKFNTNLLRRLNEEFSANFKFSCFEHYAFFNKSKSRIEMHLISKINQEVNILNEKIYFRKGESIHTENSYKYTLKNFEKLFSKSGYIKEGIFTDERDFFAVYLLKVT